MHPGQEGACDGGGNTLVDEQSNGHTVGADAVGHELGESQPHAHAGAGSVEGDEDHEEAGHNPAGHGVGLHADFSGGDGNFLHGAFGQRGGPEAELVHEGGCQRDALGDGNGGTISSTIGADLCHVLHAGRALGVGHNQLHAGGYGFALHEFGWAACTSFTIYS